MSDKVDTCLGGINRTGTIAVLARVGARQSTVVLNDEEGCRPERDLQGTGKNALRPLIPPIAQEWNQIWITKAGLAYTALQYWECSYIYTTAQ